MMLSAPLVLPVEDAVMAIFRRQKMALFAMLLLHPTQRAPTSVADRFISISSTRIFEENPPRSPAGDPAIARAPDKFQCRRYEPRASTKSRLRAGGPKTTAMRRLAAP